MTPLVLSRLTQRYLSTLIFLFVPTAILAPHAIVWVIIFGGLIAIFHSRQHPLQELPMPLVLTVLAFPLWGLLTSLWSINPIASLILGLKILALVIFGLYWCRLMLSLPLPTCKKLTNAFMGGLCFGLFFLIVETAFGDPWRYFMLKPSAKAYAHGSLILALSSWPAIFWAFKRPYSLTYQLTFVTCLMATLFWILFHIDCDSSLLSLFLGICVFICSVFIPRITSFSMRLFVPLLVILFPLVSLYAFKPENIPNYNTHVHSASYIDRFYIWNEIATTIFEQPWLGIGLDGTRYHPKAKIIRHWSYVNNEGELKETQSARFPMHPHNAILQLWLELGFVGMILGVLSTYIVLHYIYQKKLAPLEQSIAGSLFIGIFIIDWVSVGFWQNWWIAGIWIIIGLTITMFNKQREFNESIQS